VHFLVTNRGCSSAFGIKAVPPSGNTALSCFCWQRADLASPFFTDTYVGLRFVDTYVLLRLLTFVKTKPPPPTSIENKAILLVDQNLI